MIEHIEVGEVQEDGPYKGKPFIKAICNPDDLKSLLNVFQQAMQVNMVMNQYNDVIKQVINGILKK